MSIPLVQNNDKDAINTSIIAIKRNIERINMLLGLSNSEEIDTSEFVKKSDIVDEVTVGNMQSVTSNAVAKAMSYSETEQFTGKYWIDGKKIYRKVLYNVTLPNNTLISILNVYENVDTIISLRGEAFNGSITMPLPHIDFSGNNIYRVSLYAVNKSYININSNTNTSAYKADIITEYTKTTD